MKDMGEAKSCVGIRINQTDNKIKLDQLIYINEILLKFWMTECHICSTPSCTSTKLSNKIEEDN